MAESHPAGQRVASFDFLAGTWKVDHRRLRRPLTGDGEWVAFRGTTVSQTLFDGAVSLDEYTLDGEESGLALRLLHPTTGEWTIYWVSSRDRKLQPPVRGCWDDGTFEGVGDDSHNGRAILARYRWSDIQPDAARWEQAFSVDGGRTWETNWVMAWARTG